MKRRTLSLLAAEMFLRDLWAGAGGPFWPTARSRRVLVYSVLFREELQAAHTNTVSLCASGAVAPMEDLRTLKEQQREQKLFPQLLQLRRFFSTENTALQVEQFPVLVLG